jgi:hypothetical protein
MHLIDFSYEKSAARRYRQCFLLYESCWKMYTILSAVNRGKMTSWRLFVTPLAAPSIREQVPHSTILLATQSAVVYHDIYDSVLWHIEKLYFVKMLNMFVKMMNTFVNMTNLRLLFGRWGWQTYLSFWWSKVLQCNNFDIKSSVI